MILNLTPIQKKLLDYTLVSAIVNETNIVFIPDTQIYNAFSIYDNSSKVVEAAIDELCFMRFKVKYNDFEKNIGIFDTVIHDLLSGKYKFIFSKEIFKYLTNDTSFLFEHKYSKALYKIFKNLLKGNKTNCDIKFLRNELKLNNKYSKNNDLVRSVLLPAIDEINVYTKINVIIKVNTSLEFKAGKKQLTDFDFYITNKDLDLISEVLTSSTINDIPGQISIDEYKKELDKKIILEKEQRNKKILDDATKGMSSIDKSKYIGNLLRRISSRDI